MSPKQKVLVVDDSPTMRRMVKVSLDTLPGLSIGEAGTGLEAIEHLALDPVDLMILDLNMPDMHGMEVLKFVRSHHAYQKLPIIILTTRRDQTSRAEALAGGATVYLTKPFTLHELSVHARDLLHMGEK